MGESWEVFTTVQGTLLKKRLLSLLQYHRQASSPKFSVSQRRSPFPQLKCLPVPILFYALYQPSLIQ